MDDSQTSSSPHTGWASTHDSENQYEEFDDAFHPLLSVTNAASNPPLAQPRVAQAAEGYLRNYPNHADVRETFTPPPLPQRAQSSMGDLFNPGTPFTARSRPLVSPQTFLPSRSSAPSSMSSSTEYLNGRNSTLGKRHRGDLATTSQDLIPSAPPSKRATPDPLAIRNISQMSRTASQSSSSLDLDGTDLETYVEIYGFDPRQDKDRFRREQKAQKEMMEAVSQSGRRDLERIRQEQADEEMARRLQAELNSSLWTSGSPEPAQNIGSASSGGASSQPATRQVETSRSFPTVRVPPQPLPAIRDMLTPPNNWQSSARPPKLEQNVGPANGGTSNSRRHEDWDDELEIIDASSFKPNRSRASPYPFGGRNGAVDVVDLSNPTSNLYPTYSRGPNLSSTTMQRINQGTNPYSVYGSQSYGMMGAGQSPYGNMVRVDSPQTPGNEYGIRPGSLTNRMPWSVDESYSASSSVGYNSPLLDHNYPHYTYTDEAENAEALKDLLNNIRPDEEEDNLGASERGDGTPEGMADNANLYKYQQKGLAWLAKMEEGTNKGSILADDMGLGKTIQAIALMVSRKSPEPACKTTLIIAPVALIRQWESEVRNKLKQLHRLSTLVYHGSGKMSVTYEQIKAYDVVITTYGTLTADHKKKIELTKKLRSTPDYIARANEKPVLTGDQCKFYRCILDEAQNIKNKSAKSALAAYEVSAKYRLCMTGTPMMNNVVELFSLIHFLKIQPYCQWDKFNLDFARPLRNGTSNGRENAMRKLQALCKAIMLRRTKKSKMDGKPLVQLPDRHVEEVHAIFDDDEKAFYSALEAKTQLTFNKFLKAGTVGRNYSNMLTLLLRLRQACCHPHLIRDFAIAVESAPETLLENAKDLPPQIVQRIIENGITDCPICMDIADNYTIFNPCGHSTCTECFCGLSDNSRNNNVAQSDTVGLKAKFRCHACRGDTDPAKVTDYVHFKKLYEPEKAAVEGLGELPENFDNSTSDSDDSSSESDEADESSDLESLKDFIVDDDAPIEEADSSNNERSDSDLDETKPAVLSKLQEDRQQSAGEAQSAKDDNGGKNASRKESDAPRVPGYKDGGNPFEKARGKKAELGAKRRNRDRKKPKIQKQRKTLAELKKEGMRNAASRKKYFKRLSKEFIPSAKTSKCLEIIHEITTGSDPEKVIVFSQFTSLLDLLEVPMNERNMAYRRYDGSMDATSRNKSVVDFTNNANTRILLVSLKAGNAGLNLTAASHVIILDPFWNPYIEEQAIDRAHRIGQRRTVRIHRILVAETVEDRILQLQQKKRDLIEGALDEGASNSIGRLGVRELGFLFGIHN